MSAWMITSIAKNVISLEEKFCSFLVSCVSTNAMKKQWIYPPNSIICVLNVRYILFLCVIELHCCPKTIMNTPMSHRVAKGSCITMNMGIVMGNVQEFLEPNMGTAQKVTLNGSSKFFQRLAAMRWKQLKDKSSLRKNKELVEGCL